ncbi:MAG: FecR domain-containing protein, partial [Bacteriovoracia bacterium]
MNVRRTEIGFVALAALMIAVSIYQLFLRPGLDRATSSSWQAWLSSLENTAKHRRADDLVWRDLYQGDRLSEGASVFTGQAARAQLSFREGHTLSLAANTLLRLQSKDTNQILLEQGVVQTTLGDESIELEMNGKKVQLSGAGAQVQIVNDGDSTALSVMGGSAQLQEGENKIQVAVNEEVSVSADKETSKRKLSFKLLAP